MSEPRIAAIETHWNGFRFRSRLEARWAVFLSEMGVEFSYEPEGFDLGAEGWYLPDFQLTGWNYAEVKPAALSEQEQKKCVALAEQTHKDVIFLVGPPDFKLFQFYTWDNKGVVSGGLKLDWFSYKDWKTGKDTTHLGVPHCDALIRMGLKKLGAHKSPSDFSETYQRAVYAARSARFGAHE